MKNYLLNYSKQCKKDHFYSPIIPTFKNILLPHRRSNTIPFFRRFRDLDSYLVEF